MTRLTVEKLTLLTAFKNFGSILPLLLSIHTFIISKFLPKYFNKKMQKFFFNKLVRLYHKKQKD
jgi:hypothetical protein